MAAGDRLPFPFKIIPLSAKDQERIAQDFKGFPNGLASCNHWGFKVSASATEAELEDLYNYPCDERDIWVVTPPKVGTTWTQEMVWLLDNDLDYEGAKTFLSPDRWNFMDFGLVMDNDTIKKLMPPIDPSKPRDFVKRCGDPNRPSPRYIKSHLPMSLNNPKLLDTCKVVYVARNPKDLCVSLYHHCRLFYVYDFTGNLELFMQYFMEDNLVTYPCIEHMIEAWNLRHHPNMCFIFYEDMQRDLKSQIRKVATFLGKEYSDEQVTKLAQHLHFDTFKKNHFVNQEDLKTIGIAYKDRGCFCRKGKSGDWKENFTPEMNEKFTNWLDEKMKSTDLKFTDV